MNRKNISKLQDLTFDSLKKYQSNYLKTNGFFSTDILSISADMSDQLQIAAAIADRVTFAVFLQAVVDDDINMVKKCLDVEPELLIGEPDQDLVIESKLTWQKFYAEKALVMAVKRKQIKMVELLLSYYKSLEQNGRFNAQDIVDDKLKALSTWKNYNIQNNLIVLPQEYTEYAQSLADIFKEETSSRDKHDKLSEKTELALASLFNILLPKKAVKLDDYLDPELFLHAVIKAYYDNFFLFSSWDQRDKFCIRVIGLVQSVLSPEVARIFCQGLYKVVNEKDDRAREVQNLQRCREYLATKPQEERDRFERIQADVERCRAEYKKKLPAILESFRLGDGHFYYPANHESRTGMGYDIYSISCSYGEHGLAKQKNELDYYWKAYVEQKQQNFAELCKNVNDRGSHLQMTCNKAM